jgi:hypothetical protein
MNTLLRSPNILGIYLLITLFLPAVTQSAAVPSEKSKACPDGIYKGKITFTFVKRDLGPITSEVDNMLFFYGGKPKNLPQSPNALSLKNIMLCSDGDGEINTVTKHIGTYTFLNQSCDIRLNGTGQIQGKEMQEQGRVQMTCEEKATYQGTYWLQSTNLLKKEGSQGQEGDNARAGTTGSSSGKSLNDQLLHPIEKDKELEQELKK